METLFTGYKKITANGLVRRGRPEGVPLVRFDHILFMHNGKLLRATNQEQRATALFSESDAAFRRDRLMIVLRPSATRHKFWLCTGFATGRPTEHPPGRPLRYRIQAMEKNAGGRSPKKYTANGLVRRGRPEGVPLVRFDHILFMHNGKLLRATNQEQRATALFSESDAAFRRDRLMIVLRPSATRHKFWLCTGFATGRPTEHPPGRPLRYRIQAMEKNAGGRSPKKYTANGLVRRGRPEGVPLVRFDHSLFKHNSRLLRATSHELRVTVVAMRRGLLEAISSILVVQKNQNLVQ